MGRLVTALDTDLEASEADTRWLVKALEWDKEGRDNSFLLRCWPAAPAPHADNGC